MNVVREIEKLNEAELRLGVSLKASWHWKYRDSNYVFVGGLDYDLTEGDLLCVFSQFGEVKHVNLVRDKDTSESKGFCFIEFRDWRSTVLTVDNFNGAKLLGRTLRVDHVNEYHKADFDESIAERAERKRAKKLEKKARKKERKERKAQRKRRAKLLAAERQRQGEGRLSDESVYSDGKEDAYASPSASKRAKASPSSPRDRFSKVFFTITVDGRPAGRIVCELFDDLAPKSCANFRALCKGTKVSGRSGVQSYRGCPLHRIIPDFMIQGGDITRGDGSGGFSIYGDTFDDEAFIMKHSRAGMLSMANSGPNTNGSQFFITTAATPWLDGKHVVFGHVISGMDTVERLNDLGTKSGKPKSRVLIEECGCV